MGVWGTFFVFIFLLPTSLHADAALAMRVCSSAVLNSTGISLRNAQKELWAETKAAEKAIAFYDGLSGNMPSVPEVLLEFIDTYLFLGDTDSVVKAVNGGIRNAEMAYIQRQRNLQILEILQAQLVEIGKKQVCAPAYQTKIVQRWLELGLVPEGFVVPGPSLPWLRERIVLFVRDLQSENTAHEIVMGQRFDDWVHVRRHLRDMMENRDGFAARRVAQTDGREETNLEMARNVPLAAAAAVMAESVPRPLTVAEKLEQRANEIQGRIDAARSAAEELQKFIDSIDAQPAEAVATVDTADASLAQYPWDGLKTFLEKTKIQSNALRKLVARKGTKSGDAKFLAKELVLQRDRQQDVAQMMKLAFDLDKKLGVHFGDLGIYSSLVPMDSLRPTVEEFRSVVYNSAAAMKAYQRKEKWRARMDALNGNWAYGAIGAAVPAMIRAAEYAHAPWLAQMINFLMQDFYLHNAKRKFFPRLSKLRKASGDGRKLRNLLENLNAGTKDELLLVFAKSTHLASLWHVILDDAAANKETDHLHLYDRMKKAEERLANYGTISILDGSSYGRYLVAAIQNGLVLYAGQKWLLWPGWEQLHKMITGRVDLKPKGWLEKILAGLLPTAHATVSDAWEPEMVELVGFSPALLTEIGNHFEVLMDGAMHLGRVSQDKMERAGRRLLEIESQLTGRSVQALMRDLE